MNEIYHLAVVIAAATVVGAYYPGDKPILPVPTKCPKSNTGDAVHIAHESDCTKFYKCDWGRKVLQDCPYMNEDKDRLHFNKVLQVCDWPWSAGCVPSSSSTTQEPTTPSDDFYTPSTTTAIPPGECRPGAGGTKIPDKKNCKKYYVCHDDGSKHKETCPGDKVFDPRIGECDIDDGTICPKPDKPKCPNVDDPNDPIIYPHECQCDMYYSCKNGEEIKKYCPEGEGFDIDNYECVPMSEAHCTGDEDKSRPINNKPSTPKTSFFSKLFHWDKW